MLHSITRIQCRCCLYVSFAIGRAGLYTNILSRGRFLFRLNNCVAFVLTRDRFVQLGSSRKVHFACKLLIPD